MVELTRRALAIAGAHRGIEARNGGRLFVTFHRFQSHGFSAFHAVRTVNPKLVLSMGFFHSLPSRSFRPVTLKATAWFGRLRHRLGLTVVSRN